ncbi:MULTISPECIES: hypothetical protein [unclassified Crossiella]|uniref:hypothetical protein n=1 Tax=unclassified Crossiella TaxID=2620835 RepID=UPI001FFE97EF|nr:MULTISPECIES: hypothetical protein [unclassified Crossiella]MCK2244189.1 hypothetical protein [Crossiella sp. S99.2]MCK2257993.1 hypothetical protein [Crossiella sp. S99.1]
MPEHEDQQRARELQAFTQAYLAAEAEGRPVAAVTHEGWRPGARCGARGTEGVLLANHDSGWAGMAVFRRDRETPQHNLLSRGWNPDFTHRPYSVEWTHPGFAGILAPDMARLDLITPDGTVLPAQIAAGSYAVSVTLDVPSERRLDELRAAGPVTIDEELDAVWASSREANDQLREYTIRVYDSTGGLRYDGPALPADR